MPYHQTQRRLLKQYIRRNIQILDHSLEYYKRISEAFRQAGRDNIADTVDAMAGIIIQQQVLLKDFMEKI